MKRKESILKETVPRMIANLLPKRVVYFAGIRLWVKATTGNHSKEEAPAVTMSDCLDRW